MRCTLEAGGDVRVDLEVEMVLDDDVVSDDHERYHSAKSKT